MIPPPLHHAGPPITAPQAQLIPALKSALDVPFRYPGIFLYNLFEDLFLLMSAKAIGIFQALQIPGDEPYLNPAEGI